MVNPGNEPDPAPIISSDHTSGRILLVEDNPSDVDLTRRALKLARIVNPLTVVEDGQDALDYLFGAGVHAGRDVSDIPALTLLDLKLPKIPGLEVLRCLRADTRTRRMPIVILTSSSEQRDISAGYDFGVNSYIVKPVDFEQFLRAIAQLGLYWLLFNEPPPKGRGVLLDTWSERLA